MKNKSNLWLIAVYAIVLAVYILAFMLIPFSKGVSSWISFGFTAFAIIAGAVICVLAFNKKELKSKFYGLPIFKTGLIYTIAQFIVGLIICIIDSFVNVPYWVTVLLCVVLLAIEAIALIGLNGARSTIEEIEKQTEVKTQTLKTFQINIDGILDKCSDRDLSKQLNKLADDFKYSDPVSSAETEDLEDQILSQIEELEYLVGNNDVNNALAKVKEISNLLSTRNRICKAYKQH